MEGEKGITNRSRHGTKEARLAEGWRERKVLTDRCRHGTEVARLERDGLKDGGRERY